MFKELLQKIMEATITTTEPKVEPKIDPYVKPSQPVRKPSTPIRPRPGVTPKPKAANKDVVLFLKKRGLLNEDTELIHPEKQKWLEMGDEELQKIMPKFTESEQNYLKEISSSSYQDLVNKLEKYTGLKATAGDLPALVELASKSINEILVIEKKQKKYLEDLALKTVLGLDEFKIVEEAYVNDELRFKAELASPTVSDITGDEEKPVDKLSDTEDMNLELYNQFKDLDDRKLRRRLANILIQGGSIMKMYAFHLVKDKLLNINDKLVNLYGIASVFAELGYWVTPFGVEKAAVGELPSRAGSSEVKPEGDIYIINAKAICFPYLVHELSKGIYEWLSLAPEMQEIMQQEGVEDETKDILLGPGVFKKISGFVPVDKQYLLPIIHRKLINLPVEDIKSILAYNRHGRELIDGITFEAESEWSTYQKEKEEYLK